MSTVYRAIDRQTGEPIALKLITSFSDAALGRFAREASVLAQLRHPAIVRYLAHGKTDEDVPFLAMEWLDGEDLGHRLNRQGLSLSEMLLIIRQTAGALAVAHKHGVIHRDIKPSNLFLCAQSAQQCKLLDFGVAHSAHDGQLLTATGMLVGTPAYMAPEQAQGERELTPAVDVFALGCLWFRCLTGRMPFTGEHPAAILAKLLLDEAPRARTLRPDVPPAIDQLLARMLARVPERRPADGLALLGELSALMMEPEMVAPVSVSSCEPCLTHGEQRWLSVIVVGAPYELDRTLNVVDCEVTAEQVQEVVAAYGGVLHSLADGTRLTAVVHPGAATDLAARAARCAMSLRRRLPEVGIGLATGRGVLAGSLPMGEIIDRAVHLLCIHNAAEAPFGVWLDEVTAGLLSAQFDVEQRSTGPLLRAEHEEDAGKRRLLGRPTPCVGRERDLQALAGFFRECVEEPIARALLLTAEPGVGKTRLVSEFLERLRHSGEPVEVLHGRADELSAGSAFALLGRALRSSAKISAGEAAELQRTKLRARIECSGKGLADAARFLGEVAGVPFPDEDSPVLRAARQDKALMSEQIRTAWEKWMAAECAEKPVVLVLEDLHWGDAPSIKLVDSALRSLAERPLFVLALARPEAHSRFPGLWAGRSLHELRLDPLTPKASSRLVRMVLGTAASEELVTRVVQQSAGNAFFLEELIRVAASSSKVAWPETILGMMQARLDALGADAKRLLRVASVFGERFSARGLQALAGENEQTASWLDELCEREILSRVGQSSIPAETEYSFRSALFRDTAYSMLTDHDRALGHRLAGAWLERAGVKDALALAEHYARGGTLERAAHFYRRSSEQSLEGNDLTAAIDRADLALSLELLPERKGQLLGLQAEALFWRTELGRSGEKAEEAARLLPAGSAAWFGSIGTLLSAVGQQGDNDAAERYLELATATAPAPDAVDAKIICLCRGAYQLPFAGRHAVANRAMTEIDELLKGGGARSPHIAGRICHARTVQQHHSGGDLEAGLRSAEQGIAAMAEVGDLRLELLCWLGKGVALEALGDFIAAEQVLCQIQVRSAEGRLPMMKFMAASILCRVLVQQGRTHEGKAMMDAIEPTLRLSQRAYAGLLVDRACLAQHAGDFARAQCDAADAVAAANSAPIRAAALAALGRAQLGTGQTEAALRSAREAATLLSEIYCVFPTKYEAIIRLALPEVLSACGSRAPALAAVAQAQDWLTRMSDLIQTATLRESFLNQVRENVLILELSKRLQESG